MASFLANLAGNLAYDEGVDGKIGTKIVNDDTPSVMVVADNKVAHHISPLRVSPLPDTCVVPFQLHVIRGSQTGKIRVDLNRRLERIINVKLMMSKLEGYVADDMFQVVFPGSSGLGTGMNTYGTDITKSNSIILPTALTSHNSIEIARWKDGGGRLESIEVLLKDFTGTTIDAWTELFLWMEVTKVGWY